ncbi:MAG: FAD-dependent oxidoreductase [Defluviitaleaceae bacterium]|nr:FAD-dependent oxidoreductase [Defluviitaleaceae bacterium]
MDGSGYDQLITDSLLIGAGTFADCGGWSLDTQFISAMGSEYLLAHGLGAPVADAVTYARFPGPGTYRIWAYTKDWVAYWKENMAPGRFEVFVGDTRADAVFGTQGREWAWQDGGAVEIRDAVEPIKITLHDLTGFEGRCAGLFFTRRTDFVPPGGAAGMEAMRRAFNGSEKDEHLGDYDFIVVGAGIAGMCAALTAARSGLKTALINDREVLGGCNSSEIRVWLGGETNFPPFPKLGNVTREFEQARHFHYGPKNTAEIYEDEKKLAIIQAEPNIDLYTGYYLTGADTDDGMISRVTVYNVRTGGYGGLAAPLFADCTGDGTLGCLAGADYEVTTNGHMGASNLWNIEETDSPRPFPACPWAIDLSNADFPGRSAVKSIYGDTGPDTLGAWYWESGMEHPPIEMAEYARDTNFRAMYGAFDCIKNTDGDYPNHRLKFAAYVAGKRESRRLFGDVILSKVDVFNKTAYPDGIVPTTWNFDVHYPDRRFYAAFREGDGFLTHDYHEPFPAPFFVPYRCLYSRNVGNLFMAGRDVSVTHDALGSVRVMRTGGMMGETVGTAAAICKRRGVGPRGVYEGYLEELKDSFR